MLQVIQPWVQATYEQSGSGPGEHGGEKIVTKKKKSM